MKSFNNQYARVFHYPPELQNGWLLPGFAKLISNIDKNVLIYWEGNKLAITFHIYFWENVVLEKIYATDQVKKLSKQGYPQYTAVINMLRLSFLK